LSGPSPYGLSRQPLLVVISGPSGVGKNSVASALLGREAGLRRVVTATDRPRRPNETDGADYHFVSTTAFEGMIERQELVEWAKVYEQYKGIPKWELEGALTSGRDVLVLVDIQGAMALRKLMPEAISIFVAAASEQELTQRLLDRGADTHTQTEARIRTAEEEMSHLKEFDYLVMNYDGRLDAAVDQVQAILTAERCRIRRPTKATH
jgi:guanylate kinase